MPQKILPFLIGLLTATAVALFWPSPASVESALIAVESPPQFIEAVPTLSIAEVQGDYERSPYEGERVKISGIVTYLEGSSTGVRRFFVQEGDHAITCFLPQRLPLDLSPGQQVTIEGRVGEYEAEFGNAPNTEIIITLPQQIEVGETMPLPSPTLLDASPHSGKQPSTALEEYESLESMLVRVPKLRVLDRFNDRTLRRPVLIATPDQTDTSNRNSIGGLTITAEDQGRGSWDYRFRFNYNAERLIIGHSGNESISRVGTLIEDVVGVLDLSKGSPVILPMEDIRVKSVPEVVAAPVTQIAPAKDRLMVAAYNLWNVSAEDTARLQLIAAEIQQNLKSPDLIALSEVQDDSGTDGSIADLTLSSQRFANSLLKSLSDLGIEYRFLDLEPERHREGGVPGGNIRVAFLYRPDRVAMIGPPQRIPGKDSPFADHLAFDGTRKSLIAQFELIETQQRFFAIANHLKSKSGDESVWKENPQFESERKRSQQALVLLNAVESLRSEFPNQPVILMGDLNDYPDSPPLRILTEGGLLTNLAEKLPPKGRFSHRYDGNFGALDHILVSPELASKADFEILHLNTPILDSRDRNSDHDPVIASFKLEP